MVCGRMGAELIVVPSCAISNPQHYVNTARKLAKEEGGFFTNQFENLANFKAHFECTGPEIWHGTKGAIDAFVMSAGTGGTIAGVSKYVKLLPYLMFFQFHSFLLCLKVPEVEKTKRTSRLGRSKRI